MLGTPANPGKPILLSHVGIDGICLNSTRPGEEVQMCTCATASSDDAFFHRVAANFARCLNHSGQQDGIPVDIERARTVLVVIRSDYSAELWIDSAAVSISALMKRAIEAGEPVFEADVGDITAMDFPLVEIGEEDSVICLFREGWRFGLFFDFNPDRNFDRARMTRELGTLLRTMRYRPLYDVVSDGLLFTKLLSLGWFPFVEIISTEFPKIVEGCVAGWQPIEYEGEVLSAFGPERLERMFSRWMGKPHFAAKRELLRAAVDAYLAGQPIPAIKIALTEIEGVLNAAYRSVHGRGAKLPKLLKFATSSGASRAGGPDTLMFPAAFGEYLAGHTFGHYSLEHSKGAPASRHAVGHGEAPLEVYTQVRALQTFLTLDQVCFYT